MRYICQLSKFQRCKDLIKKLFYLNILFKYISTYHRGEEIVMPAEQTGLVKDNYLWKVLLRRGAGPESIYLEVGNSSEFIDRDLAEHAWGPIVSALCRAFDKAPDRSLQRKVAQTFLRFVTIF